MESTTQKTSVPSPSSVRSGATRQRRGRAVVIGRAADVPRALEHPVVASSRGLEAAGVLIIDEDRDDQSAQGAALDELLRGSEASTLFVAGPLGPAAMRIVTDIALLNGCRVIAVMPSDVVVGHEPEIVWEGERPLVQLVGTRQTSVQYAVKRLVDLVGATLGLLLLAPLFLGIAGLLRLDSRGPVLFRHRRVGRGGVAFDCLKFRTMVEDAEARLASDAALRATYLRHNFRVPDATDPRVTRAGRLLRRTSLDELPQLWNVLRGEMSLIGPRPVVPEELQHFAGSERLLLSMRPGITGMWAVTGRHGCAYPARAELELRYVRSWSLVGDLAIALRTVRAVTEYGSQPADEA